MAAQITMPPRQDRDRALAEGALALADLADGRHAFVAPNRAVRVPSQHRWSGRPPCGKLPEFPKLCAPALKVEAAPDRIGQTPGDEAGKGVGNQAGRFRQTVAADGYGLAEC